MGAMAIAEPAFERLLPAGVAVVEASPLADSYPLHDEERAVIAGAVPKRRREFAAGRHCARLALARLGVEDVKLYDGSWSEWGARADLPVAAEEV